MPIALVGISILPAETIFCVDKHYDTHIGSNISSTECDVNICLAKVWNAIDR